MHLKFIDRPKFVEVAKYKDAVNFITKKIAKEDVKGN